MTPTIVKISLTLIPFRNKWEALSKLTFPRIIVRPIPMAKATTNGIPRIFNVIAVRIGARDFRIFGNALWK